MFDFIEYIIWAVIISAGLPIILSIISLVKISHLKDEIKKLKKIAFEKDVTIPVKNDREEIVVSENIQEITQSAQEERPVYIVGDDSYQSAELKTPEEKHQSEVKFGSKWLTIVGIVSMLFGIGFFLNYAFEHDLISESGRVILGFLAGILFVILGDKFKNKLKDYAHYLIGGGFAIIMLSAYFGISYNLYPNAVAFILMLITTFFAGLLAHKLNSKILAGTTILAGFLAPVLASTGQPNEIILFNYILILLGGMFWLVFKHGWNFLIWGSLLGTAILYGGSFGEYYTNSVFWIYWIYLIIFFLIFALAPYYAYKADKEDGVDNLSGIIISAISGLIFIAVTYWMFYSKIWSGEVIHGCEPFGDNCGRIGQNDDFKSFYWIIGLIPALTYLWISKLALKNYKQKDQKVLYFMIGMASFSIAMIPALQFSGKWISFAWLIEAVALGWIFWKNDLKVFLNLGLISLGAGLLRLFFVDSHQRAGHWVENLNQWVSDYIVIFNERTLIYAVGVSSIFALAYFAFQRAEKGIAKWLGIIANLFILFWIYLELDSTQSAKYIDGDTASLLLSVFYLLYSGLLIWIGIVKRYAGFRMFGLFLIGFIILKTYFVDVWNINEVARILAFIILGGFILVISFYYSKISTNLKEFLKLER